MDVTSKATDANDVLVEFEVLATGSYPNAVYVHQGWLTEDHTHLLVDDEGNAGYKKKSASVVDNVQIILNARNTLS